MTAKFLASGVAAVAAIGTAAAGMMPVAMASPGRPGIQVQPITRPDAPAPDDDAEPEDGGGDSGGGSAGAEGRLARYKGGEDATTSDSDEEPEWDEDDEVLDDGGPERYAPWPAWNRQKNEAAGAMDGGGTPAPVTEEPAGERRQPVLTYGGMPILSYGGVHVGYETLPPDESTDSGSEHENEVDVAGWAAGVPYGAKPENAADETTSTSTEVIVPETSPDSDADGE